MAAPVISSVTLTPQTVEAGKTYKIEVAATAVTTLGDLRNLTWRQVKDKQYTWRKLSN